MSLAFAFRRFALAAAFASVAVGASAGVSVRFSSSDPTATPFPSDRFTVRDWGNTTFRRVKLPMPTGCASTPPPAECGDIAVINELDGFSTQPRITIPFTGAIDPASVSSNTIYLVNLGDTLSLRGFGQRVGINQVVWDVETNTLVLQPDELLQQHSRYVLIVTDGVRDAKGHRIESGRFHDDNGRGHHEYDRDLRDGMRGGSHHRNRIVAASLFTTQSITADLQKIAHQIKRSQPAEVDFNIGTGAAGPVRAVFALSEIQGILFNRQIGTAPTFTTNPLFTPLLAPAVVGKVAYGRYTSPDYQTDEMFIPATDTLTGHPTRKGSNGVIVQIFLPAGSKPSRGWPVAIFGHGFTDSMYGVPWTQVSTYASQGIATISINVVGHGGGAAGTLSVLRNANTPVSVPAGGRGIDQDGNGTITETEGVSAAAPRDIIGSRDGLRQTVVDLMQLVRQIEAGIDVDGDRSVDFDANRIYYAGQSFGGIYGTILMGVERNLKAGVLNVPGGSITEIARLSPSFRGLTLLALNARGLLNAPPPVFAIENIPLRDEPPRINTVVGAMDIQKTLDRFQWVQQSGSPVSYAQHIVKQPLPGNAPKPVIVQFARGDQTVPNPTSSALLRAGDLADRATYFRNDLVVAAFPTAPKNAHGFLANVGSALPQVRALAFAAQGQIATFFATNGATTIDPDDTAGVFFEVPIAGPLPEGLNFIP